MNIKRALWLGISIVTLYSGTLLSKRGYCMDNSYHLKQAFDHKAYHYVDCYCHCKKVAAKQGICACCGHARDAQPLDNITSTPSGPLKRPPVPLKALITAYKKHLLSKN